MFDSDDEAVNFYMAFLASKKEDFHAADRYARAAIKQAKKTNHRKGVRKAQTLLKKIMDKRK